MLFPIPWLAQLTSLTALTELADGVWILRTGPIHWKIVVDYTSLGREKVFESAIVDLPWFVNGDSVAEERDTAHVEFLNQFETIQVRWNDYEQITEDIISSAANYQKSLLQVEGGDLWEADEDILVLLALRCLVISHDLSEIGGNLPCSWVIDEDFDYKYWQISKAELCPHPRRPLSGQMLDPSIELWQMSEDYELPNDRKEHTNTLRFLLRKTVQTAQKLLLRGRPEDWPTIFYTLCLLMVVYGTFDLASSFTRVLRRTSREFRKALKSLIRLFLYCCGDLHPLNNVFDIKSYALMVGGNTLPVEHYMEMNSIWIECRTFSNPLVRCLTS
jgi:hypothetical protein